MIDFHDFKLALQGEPLYKARVKDFIVLHEKPIFAMVLQMMQEPDLDALRAMVQQFIETLFPNTNPQDMIYAEEVLIRTVSTKVIFYLLLDVNCKDNTTKDLLSLHRVLSWQKANPIIMHRIGRQILKNYLKERETHQKPAQSLLGKIFVKTFSYVPPMMYPIHDLVSSLVKPAAMMADYAYDLAEHQNQVCPELYMLTLHDESLRRFIQVHFKEVYEELKSTWQGRSDIAKYSAFALAQKGLSRQIIQKIVCLDLELPEMLQETNVGCELAIRQLQKETQVPRAQMLIAFSAPGVVDEPGLEGRADAIKRKKSDEMQSQEPSFKKRS